MLMNNSDNKMIGKHVISSFKTLYWTFQSKGKSRKMYSYLIKI